MYVCMYVCVYVSIYLSISMNLCMYVCMNVCMCVCIYTYVYMCIRRELTETPSVMSTCSYSENNRINDSSTHDVNNGDSSEDNISRK